MTGGRGVDREVSALHTPQEKAAIKHEQRFIVKNSVNGRLFSECLSAVEARADLREAHRRYPGTVFVLTDGSGRLLA